MAEIKLIEKNGEILYLYDAKMCNPNGDPDDENRPRMDLDRERNLVSDVRLKRYIRDFLYDYFQKNGGDQTIYVTKAEGVVNATERLKRLLGLGEKEQPTREHLPTLLQKLVDVRLFGATMPVKGDRRGEGEAINLTGPVQFNWGYSLNRVQLVESNTLSSQFASEADARQGTFGKDYRLYYSFIAFHGIISARRAAVMYELANGNPAGATSERDLELLDQAMLKAIPLLATRSKIGQYPRLYLRFEFTDADTFMGDMREDLRLEPDTDLRSIQDVKLEIGGLEDRILEVKNRINRVFWWQDRELTTQVNGSPKNCGEWLAELLGSERVIPLRRE
ncbi:type I-B CRISPR-associated protein Cas7/Csh2 [Ammonifex thiophilus]|uniref:Type I-B CRISPR-associated protein Cas7/Csh2 n=1 Tax=Ammonifex thiophilus TaxID=444093 RepID=A0A3D8P664_9THEO|nr:type I-B CRISPR-associated protein Cas7/Csh2 [Ammonifex thiophilus]RDV83596.1 type I-B CRISPR-associated protein Cas7/Csh2 [Ammonifex thiophilus]